MNKLFFIMLFSISSLLSLHVHANTAPKVLVNGFNAYKESGAKPALEAWIKGSAIDGSKEALAQANMLAQIGDYYGKYLSYELVKVNHISQKVNVYLVVINYEKGSVFAKFFTYIKPDDKEVIQTFNFNTNADLIWPMSAIYGTQF